MIEIPSAVYSLEFHEIFPYNRFAYNTLRIGVEVLHEKKLPESILVSFLEGTTDNRWWKINAGIGNWVTQNGLIHGFRIATSPLTPLLIFGVCHILGPLLFEIEKKKETFADPLRFQNEFIKFGNILANSLNTYRDHGLASAIRYFYTKHSISVFDIQESMSLYDSCSGFIANHEIAHAFVGQLASNIRHLKSEELQAFELIVDLVATQWLYKKMIVNTPDSHEYRIFRERDSYEDCIVSNAFNLVKSQILNFLFFVLASAFNNNGQISLKSGFSHPHTLLRHTVQNIHFTTLISSNWTNIVGETQLEELASYSLKYMGLFINAGFLSRKDFDDCFSQKTAQTLKTVEGLIDEFGVTDLEYCKNMFSAFSNIH
jgi:hypothetical protein